jgi:hypothetical protein
MVAFTRFLTAVFTLASASLALALPTANSTLDTRAVDLVCGADRAPLAGLASADESRLAVSFAAAAAPPPNRIINVYWSVDPMYALTGPLTHYNRQERHSQG